MQDLLGFDAYAKTLAGLIANKENATPLVIGVYGPWGSGKTTLMKTMISHLKKNEDEKKIGSFEFQVGKSWELSLLK
ncbi:MAG: P-loop NTPase fold protein [Nitrospirota bacterium]